MKAAIVGAGLMGRWHAHEAGPAGGSVVGVCDADLAAAERLAGAHAGARAFADFDAMLATVSPDVVHVCTPPASHVELAERALRSGAHAIVEKPVAATAQETERLLRVADSCRRLLCPVHQYPFQRSIREALSALPDLAPVLDFSWAACSAGAEAGHPQDADEIAADVLAHPLSVLQRILAVDPGQLQWSAWRPRSGELRAFATAAGTSVCILISMGGRPTCNDLRLTGAGGTLRADLFHGFAIIEPPAVSRLHKVARPFLHSAATARVATVNLARRTLQREPAYPGLRALITDVYAFARNGGAPPITHAECLAVARARDRLLGAVVESHPA